MTVQGFNRPSRSAFLVFGLVLFAGAGCQISGPPALPDEAGQGPCIYSLQVDGQQRDIRGLCPPVEIQKLWPSLPEWFQVRFRLLPDEVLRGKLRLYSGPGQSRALIIDGRRYDLISPDLKIRSENRITIE